MTFVSRTALAVSFALLPALCGCAQNAIFELHVRLPARGVEPGARFARIQVQPTTASFETSFDTGGTAAVELPEMGTPRSVMVSVLASPSEITAGLHVKVLLCEDAACTTPLSERWYAFNRVFYTDRYTCFEAPFDSDVVNATLESEIIEVNDCDISGCRNSNVATGNCTGGVHDCLSGEAIRAASYCTMLRDSAVSASP